MVFVEQNNKRIPDVCLELICEAKRLATTLGVNVEATVIGHQLDEELKTLAHYGCNRIFYTDDKRLSHFTSLPYAKTVVNMIKKYQPQIVLFGATVNGRDIAPRVASDLKCGLTADCTALEIGEYKYKGEIYQNSLMQIRPAFGGNIVATIVSPESNPSMATVREGVMKLNKPDSTLEAELIKEPCGISDDDFITEVLEIVRKEKNVDLKSAPIIVAAGMGASDGDSLAIVKELAETLGGKVGASRPVIDAGLMPIDHQVGQTGVTVRPNLYIACGISGQIQHSAGMSESKRIIAINKDPDAPIFKIAHYGIVGEVENVLPKMIKAYKEKDFL